MKEYLKNYILKVEMLVNEKLSANDIENIKTKIMFFQHERLIHLLVTLTFCLFTLIFMALGMISLLFLIPFAILIVFDIFYIIHYFFLENSVQYLYKLYDKILSNN